MSGLDSKAVVGCVIENVCNKDELLTVSEIVLVVYCRKQLLAVSERSYTVK